MQDMKQKILVWLPSPMGDAILCTPALRAIRRHFESCEITFLARPIVRDILSPSSFNDAWLEQRSSNPFAVAKTLRQHKFNHAILFKNSFASALAVLLAGIPSRTGYAREGRGLLLTDRLYPPRLRDGRFKPLSMVDYYLAIAAWLGTDTMDRHLELLIDPQEEQSLRAKLPEVVEADKPASRRAGKPVVILVPGGAFGPSKCWPAERYAQTADWLIDNYDATIVISVSPDPVETQIAQQIIDSSRFSSSPHPPSLPVHPPSSPDHPASLPVHPPSLPDHSPSLRAKGAFSPERSRRGSNLKPKLINLAEKPVTLGELKALFAVADLVITNDTGPRHIAIAFGRKVVTLFGPNDPIWTDTGYENEIQIVGDVPCAPCSSGVCKKAEHLCMQAITVETVCDAVKQLLEGRRTQAVITTSKQKFVETSEGFFIDRDYEAAFGKLGLTSIDGVFSFHAAKNLTKNNLADFRARLEFQIDAPGSGTATTVYLKRYDCPPILVQIKNWLSAHRRRSCGLGDCEPVRELAAAGIHAPKMLACGDEWGLFFEKRSFSITERIPNAESLERRLPDCFGGAGTTENMNRRREFIRELGRFIRRFHATEYCHRDLYFSHVFCDDEGRFHLIDLSRAFKPVLLRRRFQVKDIAQLHYSAPGGYFSRTDRLRFYLSYTGRATISEKDKAFIHKVVRRAKRMARHDTKHGRAVPYAGCSN
jgi:heptosyltransferase-2